MASVFFYFAIFTTVFLLGCAATRIRSRKIKNVVAISSFAIILLAIALRYRVGTDYDSYVGIYNTIRHTSWNDLSLLNVELPTAILFKTLSYVVADSRIIFLLLGLLSLYPIYKINKLSEYKYLPYSILTYCVMFLPFSMNGMRQGIAISFSALAFYYLISKTYKKSLVNFIIATLFHPSALLILPHMVAYSACRKFKWNFGVISLIISMALGLVILFVLNDILLANDVTTYKYILGKINVADISLVGLILNIPIVLILLLNKDATKHNMNSLVYSGIFFEVIGTAARFLSRFALYFTIYEIILIPGSLSNISKKQTRAIVKLTYVFFLIAYFIIQYYVYNKHEIIPYRTWLFEA